MFNICCADRSWIFIFWSWKSHGKSMLKNKGATWLIQIDSKRWPVVQRRTASGQPVDCGGLAVCVALRSTDGGHVPRRGRSARRQLPQLPPAGQPPLPVESRVAAAQPTVRTHRRALRRTFTERQFFLERTIATRHYIPPLMQFFKRLCGGKTPDLW